MFCISPHHDKKKLPSRQLLSHIPHPVPTGLYQRFSIYIGDFSTYISDFFIISTVRHRISTYRQFSATYLCSIPCHYNKKKLPNGNFFSTYPTSYSLKYINDFSNISIISPLISTILSLYRRFNTRYRFKDNLRHSKRTTYPIPQATYCRTLRLKR
ncbi:hypothetical protein COD82_10185 [Bacillus cereus]|nr:hypothetical protein CON49_01110 [Bacillus cereus]PER02469.1 hypothetical protein CN483_04995 [Bacillus cereus]PER66527.1 hypothetical protein CN502_16880 [Bacillus cereus]PES53801.1 hypothetical protein CN515_08030 [Bacillus cereus]PET50191.1 hypothetical protein CN521_15600 [Bacillus cereus]